MDGGGDLVAPHRAPEAAGDQIEQLAPGTTERTADLDIDGRLQRNKVVAERDPARVLGGADLDIGELTHAEQVSHALADLPYRQRLAGPGLEQVQGRAVPGRLAISVQLHLDHWPPDEIGDLGGAARRRGEQQHRDDRAPAHTRNSKGVPHTKGPERRCGLRSARESKTGGRAGHTRGPR